MFLQRLLVTEREATKAVCFLCEFANKENHQETSEVSVLIFTKKSFSFDDTLVLKHEAGFERFILTGFWQEETL